MRTWILSFLFLANTSWAEVGRVLKITGDGAYIMRESGKVMITAEMPLELNDSIFSGNSNVVLHVYPETQLGLTKNSSVKISENTTEENTIDFVKGIIRVQVIKDDKLQSSQKVQADGVSFVSRGAEFEVSLEDNTDVSLNVFEGQVNVSSPFIQSFVPEIVKANEGMKFDRGNKNLLKKKFAPKNKDHMGFVDADEIQSRWKLRKSAPKSTKANKRLRTKGP
jgi:hypothetical protein